MKKIVMPDGRLRRPMRSEPDGPVLEGDKSFWLEKCQDGVKLCFEVRQGPTMGQMKENSFLTWLSIKEFFEALEQATGKRELQFAGLEVKDIPGREDRDKIYKVMFQKVEAK
ncbi:hypothetical protein ACFL2D_03215 [Patescibacteria group bacterium]